MFHDIRMSPSQLFYAKPNISGILCNRYLLTFMAPITAISEIGQHEV